MSSKLKNESAASSAAPAGAESPVSSTRRRVIKGVATGSVLMTVASRPAMGAWCTPSAWVSGNLSQPGNLRKTCGGRSPGFWKTQPSRWPKRYAAGTCKSNKPGTCTDYKSDGTPFHRGVINPKGVRGPFFGTTFGTATMMQVLWQQGHAGQLGAHIVAALLSAATVPDYGMDENTVKEIWRQIEARGFYQPSVGDPMYPQDVLRFLQNTFDAG